jgi:hypothetical protein
MNFDIHSDTDRSEIERTVGSTVDRETVRTSDARQRRLQKNVQRQARNWDTRVDIDEEVPTAHVESNPDGAPHVVVTGEPPEQAVTSMDGRAWDWQAQRAFGVHEVGHIRYTDMEDAHDRLNDISRQHRGTAHSLHNAAEDGAIEKQITRRWPNYYEVLRNLRANVFGNTQPGIPDPEMGGYVFPVAHAAQAATLDLWTRQVYDLNIGTLDGLLDDSDDEYHFATEGDRELFEDEVLPLCRDLVDSALHTPNAVARNEKVFDVIEDILDVLPDADADGESQQNGRSGSGDDGAGMPDDSRDNHSGEAEADAEQLQPEEDADPSEDDEGSQSGAGGGDEDEDGDPASGGAGDDDLEDLDDYDIDDEEAAQALEQANDDAREEAGLTGDLLDELGNMQDALADAASDAGLRSDSIVLPTEPASADEGRFNRAQTQSGRLAQILRQRLQSERRTKKLRNRRRGRLDGSNLHRTATGEKRVKQRKEEPEEKDYHCVIVLDRSGSMTSRVGAAEEATGMLLMALEEVGVETMLLELYSNEVRLAKPFSDDTRARKDRVFHGDTSGGTPLTQVLKISRERLNQEGGNRFMFVVTDGQPSSKSDFRSALQACTFPVVGVTINDSAGAGEGCYHRSVTATPGDDLQQSLTNLVQEIMF